ncbi:MAG: DNA-directed RNA polymerase subunit alpha [Chlorobi bacterium]|nr:DNA-directed RNA polymerase subunit alpha [Chlorobiota bacterium]
MGLDNLLTFVKPEEIKIEKDSDRKGRLIMSPLERGYGITIGNALRRVLLSSLEGYAVVMVRIDGVLHEFSTIPGVMEDVSEIVLNLKQVRFKYLGSDPIEKAKIKIEISGQEIFKAGDIEKFTPEFEITNKDLVICHMEPSVKLNMELFVYRGRGYLPQEEILDMELETGIIPIDAIFSPVKKVRVDVQNVRVGKYTNYDKLILEVETDGTVSPEEAIRSAASILIDHFGMLTSNNVTKKVKPTINISLDDLKLGDRIKKHLNAAGIESIEQLLELTVEEALKIKGLGEKSIADLRKKLNKFGLDFKTSEKAQPQKESSK